MKSLVLKCPFCGATKEVVKPNAKPTSGGISWSDGMYEDPAAPAPSPIQKCPRCGDYYFMDEVECCESDHETAETGRLSLKDTTPAERQYRGANLTNDQKKTLYLTIIRAFNDEYRKYPGACFLEGGGLYMIDQITRQLLTFKNVDNVMKGELLRELRSYDQSVLLLEEAKKEQLEKTQIIDQIIEQAKNRNYKVFPLRTEE